jgi:hypothetical protein
VSATAIGLIVFALVFGSALLAMYAHRALPEDHLSADSKDVVKLGVALIATMSALVLSLLVASAKSAYDTRSNQLAQGLRRYHPARPCFGPLRARDEGCAVCASALGRRHGGAVLARRGRQAHSN